MKLNGVYIAIPEYVRLMSSAYILGCELDKQFGKSLINTRNRSGPRIVP
jgi:hypothetical protein